MKLFQKHKTDAALLDLRNRREDLGFEIQEKVMNRKITQPLMVTKREIDNNLEMLMNSRERFETKWQEAYDSFSTWEKLNTDWPDYTEIDGFIEELQKLKTGFRNNHDNDLRKIDTFYSRKEELALKRLDTAYNQSIEMIQESSSRLGSKDELLQYGIWASIFGMSASLANDLHQAHGLYDALRNVNDNFSGMSDIEIWWETLWMNSESLTGLAALAKGAYFEQLVAEDTGGVLFEYFNHPGTDIVIDGEEIQLKATDSLSYINSVDEDITVMATSEIADRTDVIDSGISNLELTETTALALGGTVVDVGDGVVDGILYGLGGLGTFASLRGIGHAAEKYNNGGDGAIAIEEGIEIAITGTLKGICDMGDMVYGAATSNTGRAIGRGALKTGKVSIKLLGKAGNALDKYLSKHV